MGQGRSWLQLLPLQHLAQWLSTGSLKVVATILVVLGAFPYVSRLGVSSKACPYVEFRNRGRGYQSCLRNSKFEYLGLA